MTSPRRSEMAPRGIVVDKNLETLAYSLDGLFRVPGTDWRFGLDAIVGLIPGLGDAITSFASFTILIAAVRYRVPKIVILRMAMNLGIDYVVGTIPIIGDAFDFVWKANQMNMNLLRSRGRPLERGAGATTGDYAFVIGIVFGLIAILIGCIFLTVWVAATLWHALTT